jgi:hypothetical protein
MTNTIENFLESKQTISTTHAYHCYLPDAEKQILSKFYEEDAGAFIYTETCYDKDGRLFINEGIESAVEELEELELETGEEDRKAFLKTVISILEKCADAGIDVILF